MNGGLSQFNRRVLQVSFIVAPLLVAALLFFLSRQMYFAQLRSMNRIGETILVTEQLTAILADLDRMESSERGFFLDGSTANLTLYMFSRGDIAIRFGALKFLGRSDPQTASSIAHLRPLVDARISEMSNAIALKKTDLDSNKESSVKIDRDLRLIYPVRELLSEMGRRQSKLLIDRRSANNTRMEIREVISTILLCLSASVVIVSGVLLLRIRELQSIITICAWTQRVNFNGKWMRMEEFLWERFRVKVSHGISEEAFEGVMGIVGKNIKVSDGRAEKTEKSNPSRAKSDSG
jgi:CHASE3 domain sensor protein